MPEEDQGRVGEQQASDSRREQIAANLAAVREDIADAARKANRDPSDVTLIAVTKTYPASDVRVLAGLGVLDVGENRDQEAAPKAQETAGLGLRWHFIGQLQTNKASSVAGYADFVHSVDRARLVPALAKGAVRYDKELTCLVQVDLGNAEPMDDDSARGGAFPDRVPELADAIAAAPGLRLGGLMAVAPLGAEPGPAFERLYALAMRLRTAHPSATMISAGMSGDLGEAVAAGATHVRVGSAILGIRR
ncbi:YggS family pyridoxal phosphate-dependent enzyme [Catenulispora pinisilvae]|uniref:YggS family pyridoxal phosphate-dependent enzyme n=1 Tax=Catenulispora pinisilvae TaxID=2705253 RepID=UPI001890F650|nr:YggS family pyridoxal phosphate-dependent enzyme [Catenulispora pinisilvae]